MFLKFSHNWLVEFKIHFSVLVVDLFVSVAKDFLSKNF